MPERQGPSRQVSPGCSVRLRQAPRAWVLPSSRSRRGAKSPASGEADRRVQARSVGPSKATSSAASSAGWASKALAQASSTGSAAPASGTPMSRWPLRPRSWIETPAPASMNSMAPLMASAPPRIEPGLAPQRAGGRVALQRVEARAVDRQPVHLVAGMQPGRVGSRGVEQRQRRAPEQMPAAGAAPGVDRAHAAGHRDRPLGHHRARRRAARPLQRGRQPAHVGKAGLEAEHVDAKGGAGHQADHLLRPTGPAPRPARPGRARTRHRSTPAAASAGRAATAVPRCAPGPATHRPRPARHRCRRGVEKCTVKVV